MKISSVMFVGRDKTVSRPRSNITHRRIFLSGEYMIFLFVLVFIFVVFVFVVFVFAVFVFVGRDQRVSRSKNSLGKYHICGVLGNLWHGFISFWLVAFCKDVYAF